MGDMELQVFSERLKLLRLSLKITQKDFADKIGITASALSSYENNLKNPSIAVAKRIAEAFNVSIDWLCGLTNDMNNDNDLMTYADLIRIFLKIQKLEFAPYNFYFKAYRNHNSFKDLTDIETGIFTRDEEMYTIIQNIQKMQSVLNDGTIDQNIYNTWLEGFLEKYNVPLPTWESITGHVSDDPPQD